MFRAIILFILVVSNLHKANACEGETTGYEERSESEKHDDDLSGFGMIATQDKYRFKCCGTIQMWRVKAGAPGEVALQVWRPTNKNREYRLMGQNVVKFDQPGIREFKIPVNQRISVGPEDAIGWYTKEKGVVVYDDGGTNNNFRLDDMPADVKFGTLVDWSSAKRVNRRSYVVETVGAKNFLPTVRNLPEEVIISKDHPLGDLFDVEVSDNDKMDIADITVSLQSPSQYFEVKKGTKTISLTSHPKPLKYILRVIVSDHCDTTEPFELTVIVTDPAVTNAPVAPAGNSGSRTGSEDDFILDWLVYVIVAIVIILVAMILLLIFHKKGWLHKAHRTHPPKKDMKDVEKANGNKVDDISKTEPKPDEMNKQNGEAKADKPKDVTKDAPKQNDANPKESPKDSKPDGTKTKYVKPK